MVTSVTQWLGRHQLDRYAAAFSAAAIDVDVLRDLTEADLVALGLTLGDRKRFVRALDSLPQPPDSRAVLNGSSTNSGAERRQLTVLFCDLVGSTALATQLDPEDLHDVMQAYQRCCQEVVERFGGAIVHVFGDGVMARFGYPRAHEDDTERAVRAALDLVGEISRVSASPGVVLQARIGVATGVVVIGERLGPTRERAIVGDTPHLAARLQSLAETGQVVVDQRTRRLVGGVFDCESLGLRAIKGFSSPVASWLVRGIHASDSRFAARNAGRLTEMVGRDRELAALLECWRRVESAEGWVALVSGEPGIGKSRLVAGLLEDLRGRPHVLVRWQCSPLRTHTSLFPASDWLARAAFFQPDDPPRLKLEKLQRVVGPAEGVALLADLVGAAIGELAEASGTPAERRERTLQALCLQLQHLGDERPVCFVVEDAHWIDPTSLELLDLVVQGMRTRPVLLLVTYRPEFSSRWIGQDGVTLLSLERLDREACTQVARFAAGETQLPGTLLEHILSRSDGVPLFVEELTRSALDAGGADGDANVTALGGGGSEWARNGTTMPSSLQASLSARLDRLSTIKETAQIAAAIGRDFTFDLLAKVAGCPEPVLRHALDQLMRAEIVRSLGDRADDAYRFKHALIQDAAYGSMLRGARLHLHARIADALEGCFPERCASEPEVLAHHLTEAGEARRAIEYWLASAQRALARSATLDAIALVERGLDLVAGLPPSADVNRVERTLQNTRLFPAIAAFGWSSNEVELIYRRLLDLSRESADRRELFFTLYGDFAIRIMRAQTGEARAVADRMVEAVRDLSDPDLTHHALRCRVAASFFRGCFGDMRRDLDQIAGLARNDGDWARLDASGACPQAAADMFEACLLWCTGFPDRAAAALGRAHAVAQASGRVNVIAFVLQFSCVLGLVVGDFAAVKQHSEALLSLGTEHQLKSYPPAARAFQGIVLIEENQQEGHAILAGALGELEGINAFLSRPHMLCWVAGHRAEADGLDAGLQLLDEATRTIEQSGEQLWATAIHRTRGALLARAGRDAEAEDALLAAIAAARSDGARGLELKAATDLAHLWHHRGRAGDALALLDPIVAGFTEGWTTPDLVRATRLNDALRQVRDATQERAPASKPVR